MGSRQQYTKAPKRSLEVQQAVSKKASISPKVIKPSLTPVASEEVLKQEKFNTVIECGNNMQAVADGKDSFADLSPFIMTQSVNGNNEVVSRIDNMESLTNMSDSTVRASRGPLFSETVYALNKSRTKCVAIGLSADLHFEPVVRLMGKGQCLTLTENDWHNIIMYKSTITNSFANQSPSQIVLCGVSISCDWMENVCKILKLERGGEYVYIAYESLHELWNVADLVATRLKLLRTVNYKAYYDSVINALAAMDGDVKRNMLTMLNESCSEQICISKEVMLYNFDKILLDVDLFKLFHNQ